MMYRTWLFIVILLPLLIGPSFAQEKQTSAAKLDTLLKTQQLMLKNQAKILSNVQKRYVLEGKKYGVEFNPSLVVFGIAVHQVMLSGGFSIFQHKGSEITFPVYFSHSVKKHEERDVLTMDAQYRYFFDKDRPGFFASGGVRYAYLRGKEREHYSDDYDQEHNKIISAHKFGVYFGIGYRYFGKSGFYWGADLILGSYFSDESGKFEESFMDASRILFDMSFLKIGYAF